MVDGGQLRQLLSHVLPFEDVMIVGTSKVRYSIGTQPVVTDQVHFARGDSCVDPVCQRIAYFDWYKPFNSVTKS